MVWHIGKRLLKRSIVLNNMRIIAWSNPMRRLELESGGCVVRHPGGLNQLGRYRDSWVPMLLSVTCSIWEGIW